MYRCAMIVTCVLSCPLFVSANQDITSEASIQRAYADNELHQLSNLLTRENINNPIFNQETLLERAIKEQNIPVIELCGAKKAHFNTQQFDEIGQTPLHLAAQYYTEPSGIISLLMGGGALLDAKNKKGETPLHTVIGSNNQVFIDDLIKHGAALNIQDNLGQTPFYHAVLLNNVPCITFLIEKGVDLNIQDNDGISPLFVAVSKNKPDTVALLLDKGALPNLPDKHGTTPLYEATKNHDMQLIKILLEKKADPLFEVEDLTEETSFDYAASKNTDPALLTLFYEFLVKSKEEEINNYKPIHFAVIGGNKDLIKNYLAYNPSLVNERTSEHQTPLMLAAEREGDDVELVKFLCDNHADVTLRDNKNLSASDYALQAGNEACRILITMKSGALEKPDGEDKKQKNGTLEPDQSVKKSNAQNLEHMLSHLKKRLLDLLQSLKKVFAQ